MMAPENDFFEEMYSNSVLKQFTIVVFVFGTILGLLLEFGIIWYERHANHRYRTAINQVFSTISWLVIGYIILVFLPDGIRYLTGSLNETFCDLHNFLKNFFSISIILALDLTICLRYIFIFKLTNFAIIKDDFIAAFLQLTVVVLSFWMTLVKRISFGKMPLQYYMCSGKDPTNENNGQGKHVPKYDTLAILVIISFILYVFASSKIFLYQRKIEKSTKNIELGRIQNIANPNETKNRNDQEFKARNMPKSMADLTTQLLCMMLIIVFFIVSSIINEIEPKNLNSLENRWLVYYMQIIGVALTILGISCQYYVKNKSLSNAIWRKIKGQ